MGTRPRGSRSPRATPAGRSTSPPHAATAGGPARAPGTSRGAPGGPRGRATAEGRAGGGEQRPPLSPRSRGACSRAVGRACCCGCYARRPRLNLLLTHARPRLTFSHTRSRTLRLPSAPTDQQHHTTAGSSSERGGEGGGGEEEEEEGEKTSAEHGSRCRKNVAKPRAASAPPVSGSGGGSRLF